jgi:hypothetical protein
MSDQKRLTRDELLLAAKHFAVLSAAYESGVDLPAAFEEVVRKWAKEARKPQHGGVIAAAREMEGVFHRATIGELDWPHLRDETRRVLEAWTGPRTDAEIDEVLTRQHSVPSAIAAEARAEVRRQHPGNDLDVNALADFRLALTDNQGPKEAARSATLRVLASIYSPTLASKRVRARDAAQFEIRIRGDHYVDVTEVYRFVRELRSLVKKEADHMVFVQGVSAPNYDVLAVPDDSLLDLETGEILPPEDHDATSGSG